MEQAQLAEPREVTEDRVLGGRVSLRQPKTGYRAGLDAAMPPPGPVAAAATGAHAQP